MDFSVILMIVGAIATVAGYASMVAINLDAKPWLFVVGIILFILGFAKFMSSLIEKNNSSKTTGRIFYKCPYCGEILQPNEAYCHKCGNKIYIKR